MAPFMEDAQFAVLSANIRPDQTLAASFGTSCLPYKIFTVGGEKVGVVGYTSVETPHLSSPGESRFCPPGGGRGPCPQVLLNRGHALFQVLT